MRAPTAQEVPILSPFIIAQWPDAPDGLTWLTVERVERNGDLTWMVHSAWPSELQAETAAGFHDSPAIALVLRCPERGWLRIGGQGWTRSAFLAGRFGRGEARETLRHFGPLKVCALRANGRITLPTPTEFLP